MSAGFCGGLAYGLLSFFGGIAAGLVASKPDPHSRSPEPDPTPSRAFEAVAEDALTRQQREQEADAEWQRRQRSLYGE